MPSTAKWGVISPLIPCASPLFEASLPPRGGPFPLWGPLIMKKLFFSWRIHISDGYWYSWVVYFSHTHGRHLVQCLENSILKSRYAFYLL